MENFNDHIRKPLNLYSVFGYLLPGFFLLTLLIIDYDLSLIIRKSDFFENQEMNLEVIKNYDLKIYYILDFFSTGTFSDFKIIPFFIFLLFCYLLGHLVSAFSSFIIERFFVQKILGYPSTILMKRSNFPSYGWFLGNYRKGFNHKTKDKIRTAIDNKFGYVASSDYYWLLYSYIITSKPYLAPRVHHFVNLYGFSRNTAATFILYILARLLVFPVLFKSNVDLPVIYILSLFLISSIFMIWNYLKLFKRQALDIYFLFLSILETEKMERDKN